MPLGRKKIAASLIVVSLACAVPHLLARKNESDKPAVSSNESRRALHALNRLTFGPRPGDVQQVVAMGVEQWIDLELHPAKIDDGALNVHLAPLLTLRMSRRELAENFPNPQEINQVMNGRRAMPSDPARKAIYEVQLARLQDRKNNNKENAPDRATGKNQSGGVADAAMADGAMGKDDGANANAADGNAGSGIAVADGNSAMSPASAPARLSREEEQQARMREDQLYSDLEIQQLAGMPPDQRFRKIMGFSASAQIAFADSLRGGKGQEFLEGLDPRQKEVLQAMNNPTGVVTAELAQAKLLRAVYGGRQLEEVMTDFWVNHFNVFVDKGLDRLMTTSYERDVIRPHALGKFEDLLVATAKSPAMLFYLDNWLSVGPNSAQAQGIPPQRRRGPYGREFPPRQRPNPGRRPSGLNENYGRELLELHTLSVNGGYSQSDVTEVAKVFTGWTIEKPAEGGDFKFDPRMHEPGPKFVLGHRIKAKGEGEGLEVLHHLATSPQTAHFISFKLAQRFVADDPPQALVDRMQKTFLKKKGDIREVLSVLFHSPEFWDDSTYRVKVKTPFEFVASALRATGAQVDDAIPLVRQLNNMGMPPYGAQPPTGYSMKAETWVSSSALLNRMNFALALTAGRVRGVTVDAGSLAGPSPAADSAATLSALESALILGGVSQQTHDSIVAQLQSGTTSGRAPAAQVGKGSEYWHKQDSTRGPDVNTIAGLLLGSPEFQRR